MTIAELEDETTTIQSIKVGSFFNLGAHTLTKGQHLTFPVTAGAQITVRGSYRTADARLQRQSPIVQNDRIRDFLQSGT